MQSVHLQLPADLLARVDEAAGDVPRNRWIRRAVEQALGKDDEAGVGRVFRQDGAPGPARPAPAEQPRARSSDQIKRDVQPRPKGGKR